MSRTGDIARAHEVDIGTIFSDSIARGLDDGVLHDGAHASSAKVGAFPAQTPVAHCVPYLHGCKFTGQR